MLFRGCTCLKCTNQVECTPTKQNVHQPSRMCTNQVECAPTEPSIRLVQLRQLHPLKMATAPLGMATASSCCCGGRRPPLRILFLSLAKLELYQRTSKGFSLNACGKIPKQLRDNRRIPSAVRSDSVRRPIGFRSPSNRIPFAVRSDSVRRPIGFRPPSDDLTTASTQQTDRYNTTNRPPQPNKPTAATLLFHNI